MPPWLRSPYAKKPVMSELGHSRPKGAVHPMRFPPVSDQTADIVGGPFRARLGHDRPRHLILALRERHCAGAVLVSLARTRTFIELG